MATCANCIHHSLCDYNTNISGNGKIRLVYAEGADVKCSFFQNTADVVPKSEGEWISVDERLPEESVDVLVALNFGDRVSVDTDRIYGGKWFGYGELRGVRFVTHWMPFPEAPKMKGGAE